MATVTNQFISSFHSLTGTTLGERRKALHILLNTFSRNEIDFSQLEPKTRLEEIFKVEAVIRYRVIPAMFDSLKSKNFALVKKVLNTKWFFREAFVNVTSDELVEEILPQLSFKVKTKVLHKVCLYFENERMLDEYFGAIREIYGLYLACKVLPACSSKLILEVYQTSRVILPQGDFLKIIKKFPYLTAEILQSMDAYMSWYKILSTYKKAFTHLAKSNQEVFFLLFGDSAVSFCLGWRTTERIIRNNKDAVFQNAVTYSNMLHAKQVFKTTGKRFSEFYVRLFPETVSEFASSLQFLLTFLQKLPNDQKLLILEEAFRKVYKRELLATPVCLKKFLLDLVPIEKFEFMETKPYYMSDERWSCYQKTDESIPFLKKQLKLTSDVTKRIELIGYLVETCSVNRDNAALEEVFAYVLNKHRNDDVQVRQRFLSAVRHAFQLEELEQTHWDGIHELIDLFNLNKERFGLAVEFKLAYIHYRFLNGLSVDELMIERPLSSYPRYDFFRKLPVLEKRHLQVMGRVVPNVSEPISRVRQNDDYLEALINWNKRHADDKISLLSHERSIRVFQTSLAEENLLDSAQSIIAYFLLSSPHDVDHIEGEFFDLCLSKLNSSDTTRRVLPWLLKKKPLVVSSNIDVCAHLATLHHCDSFWRLARNYSHLGIPSEFEKRLMVAFETYPDAANQREVLHALQGLSVLKSCSKFLEYCCTIHPQTNRVDSAALEFKQHHLAEKALAVSLKNLEPSDEVIQLVLKFCNADYLKLIICSLYSLAGRADENELVTLLDELSKRPVSVRKHALHLSLRNLNKTEREIVLVKFMETQHHPSMRKYIFKAAFSLFTQDPTHTLWNHLEQSLKQTDDGDKEVANILTQRINKVWVSFTIDYVTLASSYLQMHDDDQNEGQKYNFLAQLPNSVVKKIPLDAHKALVELFAKNVNSGALGELVCKSIIYMPHELERIACLSQIFPQYFVADDKEHVYHLLIGFVSKFLRRECRVFETLETFSKLFLAHVPPLKAFDLYVHLQLSLIYVECLNDSLKPSEIGAKLSAFCDSLGAVYGVAVSAISGKHMVDLFKHLERELRGEFENVCCKLMDGMIANSSSSATLINLSFLLRPSETCQHSEILEYVMNIDDIAFRAYLSHNLDELTDFVSF